jgi:hypothetical protein
VNNPHNSQHDWAPDEIASRRETEIRGMLKDILRERQLSVADLSRMTAIKPTRLRSVLHNGSRISLLELLTILPVAGYDFDLFKGAD